MRQSREDGLEAMPNGNGRRRRLAFAIGSCGMRAALAALREGGYRAPPMAFQRIVAIVTRKTNAAEAAVSDADLLTLAREWPAERGELIGRAAVVEALGAPPMAN